MDKIFNLNSVDQYNKLYGLETLNPLVSVVDLNEATRQMNYVHWHYGVYALYLKLEKACDIRYGRQNYDYQEGTIVCFAPGQDTETTLITDRVQVNVLGLLFHPDLLQGTALGHPVSPGCIPLVCNLLALIRSYFRFLYISLSINQKTKRYVC